MVDREIQYSPVTTSIGLECKIESDHEESSSSSSDDDDDDDDGDIPEQPESPGYTPDLSSSSSSEYLSSPQKIKKSFKR